MIKRRFLIAALMGIVAGGEVCTAADLTGNWIASIANQRGPEYTRVSLKEDAGKLTGSWGALELSGSEEGGKVQLNLSDGANQSAGMLTGSVSGQIDKRNRQYHRVQRPAVRR